jgi:hypothetical protein
MNARLDAEVKGKFFQLAAHLMASVSDEHLQIANKALIDTLGLACNELDPEEYYPTTLFGLFVNTYARAVGDADEAIIKLGKLIYPTIKHTAGLPEFLKTPKEFIKFEAAGYLLNHQGTDIIPRKIISESDNSVTMYAPAVGYSEKLYEGVWLGMLEMIDVNTGKVEKVGDHTYTISW